MTVDWQVGKNSRVCSASGREIDVGEEHYSALIESPEGFIRQDFSVDAWGDVDKSGFFSFWKTRAHEKDEKKKRLVIDTEAFYTFFCSLMETEEEDKILFRYLVSLILTRKRILRLDDIQKTPDGDVLVLYDRRTETTVRVDCPEVTQDELAEAQETLNQIFECQIDSAEDL